MPLRRPWVSLLLLASAVLAGDDPKDAQTEWKESLDRNVNRLFEELGADDVSVREAASEALLPMADLIVERLRQAAAVEVDLERRARLQALIDDASAISKEAESLAAVLKDPGASVPKAPPWTPHHLASRRVLQVNLTDPRVVARLRELFPSASETPMLAQTLALRMDDRSPFVAAGACRMLGVIEVRGAIPLLRKRLGHPLRSMSLAAVDALFLFRDPGLAPLLIDDAALHLASDKDHVTTVQRRQAWLLELQRQRGQDAIEALVESDGRWKAYVVLESSGKAPAPSNAATPRVEPDRPPMPGPIEIVDPPPDDTYYPGPDPDELDPAPVPPKDDE